ncbi:hypothetical protein Q9966_014159 [Columba livia]|nr:hypothetical protein Q9966_014159 [Columba livia]
MVKQSLPGTSPPQLFALFSLPPGGTNRRRRWVLWPFARRGSSVAAEAAGPSTSGNSGVLFGRPLAALCSQDGTLPQPIQDLLALLQEHGPSTEGIFRLAAGERASRELREALDSGARVQLESQPVHLLAAILKEFLRKIPSKLLQAELYQDWMSALHNTSRQERLAGLKEVSVPQQPVCAVLDSCPSEQAKTLKGLEGREFPGAIEGEEPSWGNSDHNCGTNRRRRWVLWPFARRGSSVAAEAAGPSTSGNSGVLFGRPLAALCSQDGTLPQPIQDLLALLQEHGPSTEGIFRLAAGERASRELREALDSGARVQLESQPVHLLAAILKEFLRKIPSKLLQAELYQDWMSALHNTSRQERLAGLKELPGSSPVRRKRKPSCEEQSDGQPESKRRKLATDL